MKTRSTPSQSQRWLLRTDKTSNRGFALVIILSAVVLLLALVVGFFSRVQTETQSASAYEATNQARNLSDLAINMVMTQIKSATAGKDGSQTLAWASQPGAIRTYTTGGGLSKIYKLYSSTAMVQNTIDVSAEQGALSGWNTSTAHFTDLNESLNSQYPILDPSALNIVKGFDVQGAPVAAGASANPIPMPARWLYVLKDGTVAPSTGSGANAVVNAASVSNPIVGRIAFWTDDETSKVNINTAGGGPWAEPVIPNVTYHYGSGGASDQNIYSNGPGFNGFWATPIVAGSAQECAMAQNQPLLREYQRYPGHPANTFLTAVFPELSDMDQLYSLIPRLQNEGSKGGSVRTTTPVRLDADRIYATADETLFRKNREVNTGFSKELAGRSAFFLTTSSRASDVNLFNEPRISIWPINQALNKQTAYDKLIAFCQTINKTEYYFVRDDPNSETRDLTLDNNQNLLRYLRDKVTIPVPGFGGSGILSKHSGEADQITTEIFDYIRSTNTRDTSMGGSPSDIYRYAYTSRTPSTIPTGSVVPIYDAATDTRGLGRYPTLTKVGIVFMGVAINRPGGSPGATEVDRYKAGFKIGSPNDDGTDDSGTIPASGFEKMRAMLLFEMFNPGAGYGFTTPRCSVEISVASGFTWPGGGSMFPSSGVISFTKDADWSRGNWTAPLGGRIGAQDIAAPFFQTGQTFQVLNPKETRWDTGNAKFLYTGKQFSIAKDYPFLGRAGYDSSEVPIGGTFLFPGGTLRVVIKDESGRVLQEFDQIVMPAATLPVPDIAPYDKLIPVDLRVPQLRLRFGSADGAALITEADTVRSVSAQPADFRMIAGLKRIPAGTFQPLPNLYTDSTRRHAHNLFASYPIAHLGASLGSYGGPSVKSAITTSSAGLNATERLDGSFYSALRNGYWNNTGNASEDNWIQRISFGNRTYLADTHSLSGATIDGTSILGDWDNGPGRMGDGPYINFADEGNIPPASSNVGVPYFRGIEAVGDVDAFPSFFTPNRLMPSAVMFGSLPTGVKRQKPWQTLLFRPNKSGHPGLSNPPDYVLLDLFNMPIVEPYAISEPLSTAGKVNMNYQILPYNYITRSTAIQAVLRSEQMLALDNENDAHLFKLQDPRKVKARWKLDLSNDKGTLKGFVNRFNNNDIFRSASEICSIWLVPDSADGAPGNPTYDSMEGWWDQFIPTGDNAKESSYARIYPRLTTKSNTYTVHYRVQVLRKPRAAVNQTTWEEGKDKIVAEYRGSTTIERFIDPNDEQIPDYTTASNPAPIDDFYKFRVLNSKQFNP